MIPEIITNIVQFSDEETILKLCRSNKQFCITFRENISKRLVELRIGNVKSHISWSSLYKCLYNNDLDCIYRALTNTESNNTSWYEIAKLSFRNSNLQLLKYSLEFINEDDEIYELFYESLMRENTNIASYLVKKIKYIEDIKNAIVLTILSKKYNSVREILKKNVDRRLKSLILSDLLEEITIDEIKNLNINL